MLLFTVEYLLVCFSQKSSYLFLGLLLCHEVTVSSESWMAKRKGDSFPQMH